MPEVVPFRLTQNMVHAMGPMGTEGLFRQACEVTLRLMRDQREPLMRCTHINTLLNNDYISDDNAHRQIQIVFFSVTNFYSNSLLKKSFQVQNFCF